MAPAAFWSSDLEHPVGKFKQYLKQSGVVLLLRFIAVASSLWLDGWPIAGKWRNYIILHSGKNVTLYSKTRNQIVKIH